MAGRHLNIVSDSEFEAYASERRTPLFRAALLLGCSPHDAEDAVQGTLLKAYLHWTRVARARNRDAYVARILLNTVRAEARKPWRRVQFLSDGGARQDSAAEGSRLSDADLMRRALLRLSSEQREVVILRYYLDLGVEQTAETLQIPTGTVKSRGARALEALSADLSLAEFRHERS